jgi:predicted DNA-binding transcriptional regulator AlpA
MTTDTIRRAKRVRPTVKIPDDFPHPQRLGNTPLFAAVIGTAPSTFARKLAEGKIPPPIKIGALNKWPEVQMAAVRDAGIA